jgi:hypothetical protein
MLAANTCRFGFGAAALLWAALCSGILNAQTPQYRVEGPRTYYEYYIHPGDVLQISVYRHPELSKTVAVRPNGDINLQWLNAVKVAGLPVQTASDLLRQKLPSVADNSCVTIAVKVRKGPWILKKEPYFIDVPSPEFYEKQMATS